MSFQDIEDLPDTPAQGELDHIPDHGRIGRGLKTLAEEIVAIKARLDALETP